MLVPMIDPPPLPACATGGADAQESEPNLA